MSRGPGRIERAIGEAFTASPEQVFTVEHLCLICYPGINRPEKRHRVAVIRAAENVCRRQHWDWARRSTLVFFNTVNIRSYTRMAIYGPHMERNLDYPKARHHEYTRPGGTWWYHVEIAKARVAGDDALADRLSAELKIDNEDRMAALQERMAGH